MKLKVLIYTKIEQVIFQANEQLGGTWRLPSREELKQLICTTCGQTIEDPEIEREENAPVAAKIDPIVFPNTAAEPYWSSTKNWIAPRNRWSVNFMTGDSYGRFFPEQRLAVRLVQER